MKVEEGDYMTKYPPTLSISFSLKLNTGGLGAMEVPLAFCVNALS